jgi:large subunit ribosomal protein L4
VLSDKAKGERIKVLDKLDITEFKTREIIDILTKLQVYGKKCLILDESPDGAPLKLMVSCRNLPKVQYNRAALVNGYQLLDADFVLITKAGLDKVVEVFK